MSVNVKLGNNTINNVDTVTLKDATNASLTHDFKLPPSGTITINSNGLQTVETYKYANVAVPTGVFPSGTKNITENGVYDVTNFANANIEVSGGGSWEGATVTIENGPNTKYFIVASVTVVYFDGTSETISIDKNTSVTRNNVIAVKNGGPGISNYTNFIQIITDYSGFWGGVVLPNSSTAYVQFDPACLTGDTLITLSDYTTKRIDQLTLDDKILSYNPDTLKLEADEIVYTDALENKTHTDYDVWRFSNDYQVKTVHRHRFYNLEKQAMVYMDEWNIGDHGVTVDGNKVELLSHEKISENVRHYTIFTKNQNYFANGLLSGNRYTKRIEIN